MSEWISVCHKDELPEGTWKVVQVGGREVVVVHAEGGYWAIDDECPHRGGPLSKGFLEGRNLYCPLHGWPFDVTTGQMPGSPDLCVPRHPVSVEGDVVRVGPAESV
ncbi:MAG: Rieske 2Fe-2S domain-containing protein [Candidatus Sericytochromatia bacterium]|nr:Rieske 2Fe-2S domain-containing protein [Candidatus Sericytochromatia bacterium]